MPQNESILIDADAVVRKVNHGKLLPGPVMRFIRKMVHQEDFNRNFRKGLVGWEFVEDFFRDLDVTVEVIGEENIPAEGLFTFVSNHPLGGADAGIEIAWLAKKYDGKVITAANAFLLHIKQLANYLIPVNKMSSAQSRDLVQMLDQAFKSERQVLFFPAGACSRKIDGKVQDLPWQKTFVTKSRQTHRDVIPIWFSGQNSKRFYRLDKITGFLGIGQNLAMFTLPDEMFRCRGKHFKMVIGQPIPWESFTSEKTDLQWAACVREKVYELAQ